jgi:hypothetical protein
VSYSPAQVLARYDPGFEIVFGANASAQEMTMLGLALALAFV